MLSASRNVIFVLFFLLMLGSITHVIGSNVFLLGMLIVALLLASLFWVTKFSPRARAQQQQVNADQNATVAAPLPAGSGAIYVYREGGQARSIVQVALNGMAASELDGSTFVRWLLPAGDYALKANIKGTNLTGANVAGEAAFSLAVGESMFFQVTVKMGITKYTVSVIRVDQAASLSKFARMKMIGGLQP